MQVEGLDPKAQEWLDQFNAALQDPRKRQALISDPKSSLKEFGLPIDEQHREGVIKGLQAAAMAVGINEAQDTSTLLAKKAGGDLGQHFHWSIEWWGFVMRIDHEAIKQLPKGLEAVGTLATAAFGVVKAAGVIGPNAVVVALGLAYWGAIFTAYIVTLPLLDTGKGVYLTITWPQLAAVAASGGLLGLAALPIPTTVV